jgi:hypothetical protein
MSKNPHTGSSFDDFLKEEGIYEECTAAALKRVLAWQIEQEMQRQKITRTENITNERLERSNSPR